MDLNYPQLTQRCQRKFYAQDSRIVARELLGKVVLRRNNKETMAGRIVETECYRGIDDAACHAARGRTARNDVMFGKPGVAYVYLIYGMHHCLNIVTEPAGFPAAVLIRALEPVDAQSDFLRQQLAGPGRLTTTFNITRALNGADIVTGDDLGIYDDGYRTKNITSGRRIGVEYAGTDALHPWRFGIKTSQFLSRPF